MITKKSKSSKYVSLTIGVVVALLSVWQISGRPIEMSNRFRKAAKKAVLVPVIYGTTMTAISLHISQYFIYQ
ncbi:MAG: hypothetical protein ACI82Q_001821 [Nonlabens sp.]|jgi:hypothetical protein